MISTTAEAAPRRSRRAAPARLAALPLRARRPRPARPPSFRSHTNGSALTTSPSTTSGSRATGSGSSSLRAASTRWAFMYSLTKEDMADDETTATWLKKHVPDGTWVLQEYLMNPMTYEGHKFDLRVWAVITSLKPIAPPFARLGDPEGVAVDVQQGSVACEGAVHPRAAAGYDRVLLLKGSSGQDHRAVPAQHQRRVVELEDGAKGAQVLDGGGVAVARARDRRVPPSRPRSDRPHRPPPQAARAPVQADLLYSPTSSSTRRGRRASSRSTSTAT